MSDVTEMAVACVGHVRVAVGADTSFRAGLQMEENRVL